MVRKLAQGALLLLGLGITHSVAQQLSADEYVEAAWMTTRFFGAQRSGEGPNWILDGTNYPTSFMDTYNGSDVSGGWFDCGDHIMFGQTQAYSAYVLALSYVTFPYGWHDKYTGDYTDYKTSGDYTMAGGTPNGLPDLLEELRYEADYLVKAAISENEFVHQKGDGSDHNKWVTAGKMATLGSGDGGSPRSIVVNANDAFTPGLSAAMLAIMARADPDTDRQAKYLAAAQRAYAYAKSHTGIAGSTVGNYYPQSNWGTSPHLRWADGPFLAATELFRTTNDSSYLNDAMSYWIEIAFSASQNLRFSYANVVPLSVLVAKKVFEGKKPNNSNYRIEYKFVEYQNVVNGEGVTYLAEASDGFPSRSPSGAAYLAALYSQMFEDDTYKDFLYKQVDYLLGKNSNNTSFVVGWDRHGQANAPSVVHHRGYYGNEYEGMDVQASSSPPAKNKQLGAMVGGNVQYTSLSSNIEDFSGTEPCIDINAPLVGVLGYIVGQMSPTQEPTAVRTPLPSKQLFWNREGQAFRFSTTSSQTLQVRIYDLKGHLQARLQGEDQVRWQADRPGVYQAVLRSGSLRQNLLISAF